jgi:drug/metabolite transporter (DMT)-like permease
VPLLGERLTWNALVGLLLGLSGMAVLILPDYAALTAAPLGPLYMLIAAISWATGTVFLKRARFTLPTAALTTWQLAFGGIPVILGAVAFDRDFAPTAVSLQAWLATAFALVAATIFCHWAWFRLVRRFPAVGISVGTLAIPVIGVLASAIGLGEPVGVEVVAALVLVVLALFFVLILPGLRAR